jgi:Peptidase A4 family
VPTATCSGGEPAYSAVWVGLGGFRASSQGLEQTGVDVDCTRSRRALYTAWYELLPAGAVTSLMPIRAGDRMQSAVSVSGQTVRLSVRDLTSGHSFVNVQHMSHPDLSSADWIVEAPPRASAAPAAARCG